MPQLVPFFFINQLLFGFGCGIIILFLFSKYILPVILQLRFSRVFLLHIFK